MRGGAEELWDGRSGLPSAGHGFTGGYSFGREGQARDSSECVCVCVPAVMFVAPDEGLFSF